MAHDTTEPAPSLLGHLERTLGLNESQALDALGQYLLSTEAGRALREETRPLRNQARDAA